MTKESWEMIVASAWANASKAVVISDMSKCVPASAFSKKLKMNHWKVIPYELVDGRSGKIIWASVEACAPALKLPLGVKGWYAIFVGFYSTSLTPCFAWLKLDGEPAAQPRKPGPQTKGFWGIEEIYYKAAELKAGGCLHISQQSAGAMASGCGIAYVKLVPLTGEEIAGIRKDRGDHSHRKLAATEDGFFFGCGPTTVPELLARVEVFRDTDFKTLLLHIGGADQVAYATKYGCGFATGIDEYSLVDSRHTIESIRELKRKKINPTKVLIDGAHDVGMKVHVGNRPALWSYHEPHADFFESQFYRKHPKWRTIDRDGTEVSRMSWAVPEVRKHLLDVLGEAVGFGADGCHVVFNRGCPMVLYEPAFRELFKQKHGKDPTEIPESDPRIARAWAEVVTTFMREARVMLDKEQKRRGDGKRLEMSVCVLGNEYDNLLYGIDIRRWAAEGLVDEVYPTKMDFGAVKITWDIKFFKEGCGPKAVFVSPMFSTALVTEDNLKAGYCYHLLSRGIDYHEKDSVIKAAMRVLKQGADGLSFWDVFESASDPRRWSVISRFGHMDELKSLKKGKLPDRVFTPAIHRLGDQIVDGRFPPYWGG